MDPLSVAAGIVGMVQSVERLSKIASGVRSYLNVSADIDVLLCEVADLNQALEILRTSALPCHQHSI